MDAEITVGASEYKLAKALCERFPKLTKAIQLDVTNADALDRAVAEHDVSSMRPSWFLFCSIQFGLAIAQYYIYSRTYLRLLSGSG